ncbi:MAG: hypothetical protein DIU68_014095 [Chloroflexota bacterium]
MRTKALLLGAVVGAAFGVLSGYLYTRAAEEDVSRLGHAQRISTGEILGLGLALLGIIRQVTEMGKGPDRSKKR